MFRTAFRLPFTLLGIPVLVDITFLIILPLLAWSIGSEIALYIELFGLPIDPQPLREGLTPYWLGLLAALGLFVSVVVHELGHSVVAIRYGVKVKSITLWILGGMAQFEEMPRQRWAEAVIAIVGPIVSFAIAGVCWYALSITPAEAPGAQFVLGYLTYMNALLASFNLLPALPLDGGRVLRSAIATRTSYLRATQISGTISKLLAVMLGLLGFVSFNIFLMLIAFFIYMAIGAETQMAIVAEVLEGMGVRDLMRREVQTVPPEMPVSELVQKMFRERHLGYPVVSSSGDMVGIVSLKDIQRWKTANGPSGDTTVADIMNQQVNTISESSSALEAFERMSRNDFGRLVVVGSQGKMVGIISKTDLIRAIQVRMVGSAIQEGSMPVE